MTTTTPSHDLTHTLAHTADHFSGILIDADDFRALLRSGSTERWFVRGDDQTNPIAHLQSVFRV